MDKPCDNSEHDDIQNSISKMNIGDGSTPVTTGITDNTIKDIGPPAFQPGVPWKGYKSDPDQLDPEKNPDLTPIMVQRMKEQEQEQNRV